MKYIIAILVAALGICAVQAEPKKAAAPTPAAASTTITCTVAGSTIPLANQTRTLNISDADLQSVFNWVKADQIQIIANQFNGGVVVGFNPTVPQIEWGWFQVSIVNGTIQATQVHGTTPAVVPPPISLQ